MIINAIRFRAAGEESWQAFKLGFGAGHFRNYQLLQAEPQILHRAAAALAYLLSGQEPATAIEAQVQLSDDGGHTWIIQRKPGLVRYLKDGVVLDPATAAQTLAVGMMDLEGLDGTAAVAIQGLTVHALQVIASSGTLTTRAVGAAPSAAAQLKDAAAAQVQAVALACAQAASLPETSDPKRLAELSLVLEPLYAQHRELVRQYRELGPMTEGISEADLGTMQHLAAELDIMTRLEEVADPLLQPNVSLKALKDSIAKTDGNLAETAQALGLSSTDILTDGGAAPRQAQDFRRPIEALARLEAQAKLVRATQGARKYCVDHIEPVYQQYVSLAVSGSAADRQFLLELDNCQSALAARVKARGDQSDTAASRDGSGKTWFDRFKARPGDDQRQEAQQEQAASAGDIETARMAIAYAIDRFTAFSRQAEAARAGHDGALAAIDEAYEELTKHYGRYREHWSAVAREAGLPEDTSLAQLLKLVTSYGQMANLHEQKQELTERLRKYNERAAKAKRLVLAWRTHTGSQKTVDLDNITILLAEVRDVLRYQEPKRKRYEQLRAAASEVKASLTLRTLLKGRHQALQNAWKQACKDAGSAPVDLAHEGLPDMFRHAATLRALDMLVQQAAREVPDGLFSTRTEAAGVSLFLWEERTVPDTQRLELLRQLEAAKGGELRLLLFADEGLAAMLGTLGINPAVRMQQQAAARPEPAAAKPAAKAPPAAAPARGTAQPSATLLNDRARRTLDLLNNRR